MEQAVALLAIALLANKIIELLKYLTNKEYKSAATLLSLFGAGYAALTLAAHAKVTEAIVIPGTLTPLGMLDWASLLLLGLMITATGSTAYDFKKALDQTDSAAQPKLFPGPQGPPPA